MTLTKAVDRFIADARVRGLEEVTLVRYRSDLKILIALATVEAHDTVFDFTPELVKSYFRHLAAKGLELRRRLDRRIVIVRELIECL